MKNSFNFGQLRRGDFALIQQETVRPAEVLAHKSGILLLRFFEGEGELSIDYCAAQSLIVGGARYVEGNWKPL